MHREQTLEVVIGCKQSRLSPCPSSVSEKGTGTYEAANISSTSSNIVQPPLSNHSTALSTVHFNVLTLNHLTSPAAFAPPSSPANRSKSCSFFFPFPMPSKLLAIFSGKAICSPSFVATRFLLFSLSFSFSNLIFPTTCQLIDLDSDERRVDVRRLVLLQLFPNLVFLSQTQPSFRKQQIMYHNLSQIQRSRCFFHFLDPLVLALSFSRSGLQRFRCRGCGT